MRFKESALSALCTAAAFTSLFILILTLALLLRSGAWVISPHFLTGTWQHQDITQGGIAQAIVGSLLIGMGVFLLSFPLGVGTAIFVTEYNTSLRLRRVVTLSVRNLAGVPSVVFGLFGLSCFVKLFGFGASILSAVFTLTAMTLPWIITAAIEALEAVPRTHRDGSIALGASRWQTTWKIVLPTALPGCLTGSIVSIARAMGETAPIILVGATFFLTGYPTSLLDRFMALPYHSFILATQHSHAQATAYAAATALVLIAVTLLLSMGAIVWRHRLRSHRS